MAAGARAAGYAIGRVRRERIIGVATELFSRVGYRTATILEIAEQAGISRTGLLHHFASKEALLEAVLARRDADDRERLSAARADPSGLSSLRALVDLARHNARVPHLVSLYAVLSAEASDAGHPAHDYFLERYTRSVAGVERTLLAVRAAGLLVDGIDPRIEARAVIALMDGLQVQWLLHPDDVDMAEALEAKLQQLLTVPLP